MEVVGQRGTEIPCDRLRAMKVYGKFYYTLPVTAQTSLTTSSLKTSRISRQIKPGN